MLDLLRHGLPLGAGPFPAWLRERTQELVADFQSPRTAEEFYPLLREAVSAMNRLRRQTIIEKLFRI